MRIGSLFSGYGGLDLAVTEVLGGTVAWHCEFDANPAAILAHHWPDVPNHRDVTAVDWTGVEPVDVLTGGYPCQPFSHAGKRRGEADERHLWPYVRDAISALRPRYVVLENVAGHLTLGGPGVIGEIAGLGYGARWGVVRASDAGAPHRRARLFIVATPDADREHDDGRVDGGPRRWAEPANGRGATPDTASVQRRETAERGIRHEPGASPRGRADHTGATDFGPYVAAIRRWEHVLGRPAPNPTEPGKNGPRLSPAFVEWLMGLGPGHVTGTGISRNAQLKALGNGVVPQQAALALRLLLGATT